MRKFSTKLIFILLVGSIVLPFFPVIAQPTPVPAQIPTFKVGVTGSAIGHWDGPISTAGFAGADYSGSCLEPLMWAPADWDGEYDTMVPALATDIDIIYWPSKTNTLGWNNSGGIRALDFTLRSGVTFHDGSAWNATVAKWNIDRNFVITGNLTGKLTYEEVFAESFKAVYGLWLPSWEWAPYETGKYPVDWNVSRFYGQPAAYAEYNETKTTGWLYPWVYDSVYPRIENVTILEDLPSGGKIRVYYNDWNAVIDYITDHMMISMYSYKNYFDIPMYGLGDDSRFLQPDVLGGIYPDPDGPDYPGHLIGTGPYRFIRHDEITNQGIIARYDNWWNSTAMQANGWHQVPQIAIVGYPVSSAGFSQRNAGMITGTIDYAVDDGTLVYTDMIADPDINYFEVGVGADRTFITLNCINETYWKTWADGGSPTYNLSDPAFAGEDKSYLFDVDADGTVHVDGIGRAMRKAVSYAFDYDRWINVVQEGRAVRSGGFLGIQNEYYNPSIPLAGKGLTRDQSLTIARQALIDIPFWNSTLTARGLDINNATADWRDVADSDPIFEFKLLWDMGTYDLASLFGDSIKDIGLSLGGPNGAPDGSLLVQPDVYTVLYGEKSDIGHYPWFTSHGVPTDWPGVDIDYVPALEYYASSTGLPHSPGSAIFPDAAKTNIGFHFNATFDKWIKKCWFADRTTVQGIYDNMTRHMQTYKYADIMISHTKYGVAIDEDWEFSNLLGYQFVKYVGEVAVPGVPIPGFDTAIILAFTIVTITGIGYSLNRKRKRA